MFVLFGTRSFSWGSGQTNAPRRCDNCGVLTPFIVKKGMTFFTLYFLIPIFPVSKVKEFQQCPNCKAKYDNSGVM